MSVDVTAFDMKAPDDVSGPEVALEAAEAGRIRRLALLLRVAGEYTDGSREKARAAIAALLARRNLSDKTQYITVIGAEGASTPCGYAFIDNGGTGSPNGPRRLALGIARVAPPPEETIGTAAFARAVKAAVEAGINDGGMSPADVEVVIVNVPQPTSGDAGVRGRRGRAAAALGAGLALGEVAPDRVRDDTIVSDGSLYTARVQTFTGPAIDNLEVIVIGNAPGRGGNLLACNTLTTDLLDVRSVKRMLIKTGLPLDRDGELDTGRLVATLAKLGVDPSGRVSGAPTTIFNSVTPPEKHVRAALSGALGATLHTTRLFSTFDPVQQAPIGGGTVCCIIQDAAES
jgi:cyanuric acid amidohydrolase